VSLIIQGLVTVILIGAIVYMAVGKADIPPLLVDATMLILGFWFGSQSAIRSNATLDRVNKINKKRGN